MPVTVRLPTPLGTLTVNYNTFASKALWKTLQIHAPFERTRSRPSLSNISISSDGECWPVCIDVLFVCIWEGGKHALKHNGYGNKNGPIVHYTEKRIPNGCLRLCFFIHKIDIYWYPLL